MLAVTNTPETATSQETRAELLRAQARGYTQVRHVFVQKQDGDGGTGSRASTLAAFVHARRHRALQLYLLLLGARHLIKVREERNQPPLEAGVWVRALTSADSTAPTWSKSTLSRTWAELEEMGLVHRDRRNRLVFIEPRREDGEADYESAGGRRDHIKTGTSHFPTSSGRTAGSGSSVWLRWPCSWWSPKRRTTRTRSA